MSTMKACALVVSCFFSLLSLLSAGAALAQPPGDDKVFVPPYGQGGCWALLFAGREFDPPAVKLKGPTFIEEFRDGPVVTPELKGAGGPVFLRSVQSAIVGPHARVVGYEGIRYSKRSLVLEPGRQVPDLVDLGFHERVNSLQVECVQ